MKSGKNIADLLVIPVQSAPRARGAGASAQVGADAHPDIRHDDARNALAVAAHDVGQRTVAGREQRRGGLRVLRELGAAGPLHQLPVRPGADRNLLPAIADGGAIALLVTLGPCPRTLVLRQAAAVAVPLELEALPERFHRNIALPIELERRGGEVADHARHRIAAVAHDIYGLAAGPGPLAQVVQLERARVRAADGEDVGCVLQLPQLERVGLVGRIGDEHQQLLLEDGAHRRPHSKRCPPSYMQAMRPSAARSWSLPSNAARSPAADGVPGNSALPVSISATAGENGPALPASSPRSMSLRSSAGSSVGRAANSPCCSTCASL